MNANEKFILKVIKANKLSDQTAIACRYIVNQLINNRQTEYKIKAVKNSTFFYTSVLEEMTADLQKTLKWLNNIPYNGDRFRIILLALQNKLIDLPTAKTELFYVPINLVLKDLTIGSPNIYKDRRSFELVYSQIKIFNNSHYFNDCIRTFFADQFFQINPDEFFADCKPEEISSLLVNIGELIEYASQVTNSDRYQEVIKAVLLLKNILSQQPQISDQSREEIKVIVDQIIWPLQHGKLFAVESLNGLFGEYGLSKPDQLEFIRILANCQKTSPSFEYLFDTHLYGLYGSNGYCLVQHINDIYTAVSSATEYHSAIIKHIATLLIHEWVRMSSNDEILGKFISLYKKSVKLPGAVYHPRNLELLFDLSKHYPNYRQPFTDILNCFYDNLSVFLKNGKGYCKVEAEYFEDKKELCANNSDSEILKKYFMVLVENSNLKKLKPESLQNLQMNLKRFGIVSEELDRLVKINADRKEKERQLFDEVKKLLK